MRVITASTAQEYSCVCGTCGSTIGYRMHEVTQAGSKVSYVMRCPVCLTNTALSTKSVTALPVKI